MAAVTCSRPLLETIVYRRVMAQPKVRVVEEHEAVGLEVDRSGQRVTGLHGRQRSLSSRPTTLAADLVVDASGRGSRAPVWLANLGYTPPRETTINVFSGYASRIYRRPAQFNGEWQMMMIKRVPPDSSRGGMIVPLEGDRWHVTLIGMARDYPPDCTRRSKGPNRWATSTGFVTLKIGCGTMSNCRVIWRAFWSAAMPSMLSARCMLKG
jgi:hypothetical protein